MAEQIIVMQQPSSITLYAIKKGDLMPSDNKFIIFEEFIATMKPIVGITRGNMKTAMAGNLAGK